MTRIQSAALLPCLLLAAACASPPAAPAEASPSLPVPSPGGRDAAGLRMALLREMDARIEAEAARSHLGARLLLDRVMPLAYLGVDADPDEAGGMRVTKVYPLTGAEETGLRVGDLLTAVGGDATPDGPALGAAIRSHSVGDRLVLHVRRGGEDLVLEGLLGKRPEEDEDEAEQFPQFAPPGSPPPAPVLLTFDGGAGMDAELGGHGRPGRWEVLHEDGNGFLRQSDDDPTGIRFPMALVPGWSSRDAVVRVRFRGAGGRQDRAAGVVVRFRDPANYIVVRANAVEGDLRIFRVAHGLRTTLPGARVPVSLDDDRWHELEVRAEGALVTATLDGTAIVSGYDTYVRGTRVGLWTKSDSVADFDDLSAEPLAEPEGGK